MTIGYSPIFRPIAAISDPAEFSSRPPTAIAQHNVRNPGYRIRAQYDSPVIYFDPFALVAPETAGEVHFCKHFRFAYQTEFRFVLTPAKGHDLQHFFVELGPLQDIAELVTVRRPPSRTRRWVRAVRQA